MKRATSFTLLETLDDRVLLSVSPLAVRPRHKLAAVRAATAAGTVSGTTTTSGQGTGVTLNLVAGVPFSGEVAFYPSPVLDPPLAYSADIAWGDGTTSAATLQYGQSNGTGGYVISGNHTYSAGGTYAMQITVLSGPLIIPGQPTPAFPTTIVAKIKSTAIVAPFPNNSAGGVTIQEIAQQPFTATVGTFVTIAPATNLAATITWGDGSTSAGTLTPTGVVGLDEIQFAVGGSHTYAHVGTYPIHITVTAPGPTASTAPRVVATIESTAIVSKASALSLAGTLQGTYTMPAATPGLTGIYVLQGSGIAGDMGAVTLAGTVNLLVPGTTALGRPSAVAGTLVLTNALGSVTLQLSAGLLTPVASIPPMLKYVIVSGTGIYAGDGGTGTMVITLMPATMATQQNQFTMVIN